jgi:hypothetical protein
MASLLAGHHATAEEQAHLERHGEQKPAEHQSKRRGALHPLSPDGETEANRRGGALGTVQTTAPTAAATTLTLPMS